jgi:hypothetical protein
MSDPFSTTTKIANMRTLSQPISYNNSAAATDPYEDEDISSAGIFTPFVGSNSAAALPPPPPLLSRSTPLPSLPHEEISDEDIE